VGKEQSWYADQAVSDTIPSCVYWIGFPNREVTGNNTGIDRSFQTSPSFLEKEKPMPVAKKKSTTSDTELSTSKQETPSLPDQHAFHEHLRALTRSAVRVVIEEVMREELEQLSSSRLG
jgi:hypothetical protein